jgi:hypothetical protein
MNLVRSSVAVALLCCFAMAVAGPTLPPGTALPIMLSSTLNAKNDKVGQKIEGKLMQEVHLPSGVVLKKGSRVVGEVIAVQRPLRITVQFTQLQDEHQTIPLNASLRALAASQSVFQAGLSVDASPWESSNSWTTQQVGGDFVFRGRGYVTSDQGKVGLWNGSGVWGRLASAGDCPDSQINGLEQSLWIFSTGACGAYGYDKKLTIAHDGYTAPIGQITLQATSKYLEVRGGSGWMLIVNPGASGGAPSANLR